VAKRYVITTSEVGNGTLEMNRASVSS